VVFWSNFNLGESLPYPLRPLSWSFLVDAMFPALYRQIFHLSRNSPLYPYYAGLTDLVYGRVYWNMNMIFGHPIAGPIVKQAIDLVDPAAGQMLRTLLATGELRPARMPHRLRNRLMAVWHASRIGIGMVLTPWLFPPTAIERRAAEYWAAAETFEQADLAEQSILVMLSDLRAFTQYAIDVWACAFLLMGYATVCYERLVRLTRPWADLPADKLVAGIPGTKTTEGALALYGLTEMPPTLKTQFLTCPLAELPAMLAGSADGQAWLRRLEAFLAAFGSAGRRSLIWGSPLAR
jgi:hypothetical protein